MYGSLIRPYDGPPRWAIAAYEVGEALVKVAEVTDDPPEVAYNLAGTLYLAENGWLLLTVPNALVHGVFAAMREPGVELPPGRDEASRFNAHITVMRPEEIEEIGGADRVTERGKQFHYTLGRLYSVVPDGWTEMSRVWFCHVHSPELQQLRRSYGLSSLPKQGKHAFHITCAVRRRGVLARSETAKGEAALAA